MTDASLLVPNSAADDAAHAPPRTLGGALLTAALLVGLLVALESPATVVAGAALLLCGGLAGRALSGRRTSACDCRRRVCLPGTATCVRL